MRLIKDNVEREVSTKYAVAKLQEKGFTILDEAPANVGPVAEQGDTQIDVKDLKLDELKALAKERGIEGFNSLTKKELLGALGE